MGIDRDHWGMMLFPDYMESARTTKVMRQEAFVRAVIADEAAKASAPQQKEPTTVSYERFTDRARRVMQLANQEAQRFNHEYIGTEHVAIGLVEEHAGVARFVLNKAGIDVCKIRLEVERLVKSGPDMPLMGKLPYTPRTKRVLAFAIEESQALGHLYVGTEHILLGLLREPEGIGGQVIRGLGLSLEDAHRAIKEVLGEQHDEDSEPAASEPELDEPAERAEDVPKWFTSLLRPCVPLASNEQLGRHAKVLWPKFQAEIARRVKEATAMANEVSRRNIETIVKLCCENAPLQKKIDELTAERDQARAEAEKFKTTDVGTLVADAIRADRESDERECRREIRRLRAEVERLRLELTKIDNLTLGKVHPSQPRKENVSEAVWRVVDMLLRIAELEARVVEQAKEIERLSRPVDLGAVHKARVDGIDYVYDYDARQAVRSERNAREAAEAAAAELREAWRWSLYSSNAVVLHENLDAVLAAYRKQKEPTQ